MGVCMYADKRVCMCMEGRCRHPMSWFFSTSFTYGPSLNRAYLICLWVSYDLLIGDQNFTLHACMASVLSNEPFSQPSRTHGIFKVSSWFFFIRDGKIILALSTIYNPKNAQFTAFSFQCQGWSPRPWTQQEVLLLELHPQPQLIVQTLFFRYPSIGSLGYHLSTTGSLCTCLHPQDQCMGPLYHLTPQPVFIPC